MEKEQCRGPAFPAWLSLVTRAIPKQCEKPRAEDPHPPAAKSIIFTHRIKASVSFKDRQSHNTLFPGFGMDSEDSSKLSTPPPALLSGLQLPDKQLHSLPCCFVLTRFPPPLCHKLSQLFCLLPCSTIIYLAVQDGTEWGFILLVDSTFLPSSCHIPSRQR